MPHTCTVLARFRLCVISQTGPTRSTAGTASLELCLCPAGTTPGSLAWQLPQHPGQLPQHPGLWAALAAALGVRVRVLGVGSAPCLLGVPMSAVPPAAGSTLPCSVSLGEKPHGRRCSSSAARGSWPREAPGLAQAPR